MASLIYIADPLCAWCYSFAPELAGLLTGLPDLPYRIVVGGLRANNRTPLTKESMLAIQSDWQGAEKASGLPFSSASIAHDGFIYDTEPACRAVKSAEILAPTAGFDVFHTIQRVFFADGLDMTDPDTLAEVAAAALTAAGAPTEAATLRAVWDKASTIKAANDDFLLAHGWEVIGFPTLVLERNGKLDLVSSGYAKTEVLVERLQALVDAGVDGGTF